MVSTIGKKEGRRNEAKEECRKRKEEGGRIKIN
jgi:hypothetical protein